MLDPVTLSAAVTGATAAYNGIKKAIAMGREIEDMGSQLSTWMTAVSDVDNIHKNANNPSTLDKIFNGSIENVAREERNRQIRDYTIIGITTLIGCTAVGWIIWIITLST